MKVVYFGDDNSHTYSAAKQMTADSDTLIGQKNIKDCFLAVSEGRADAAVIPIENSVEGTVNETLDCLTNGDAYICRETKIPITHCLVVQSQAELKDIKILYSHYQALAQCENFIKTQLPAVKVIASSSTSAALKEITCKEVAAIARQAGEGTKILKSAVNDCPNNTTSFIMINRRGGTLPPEPIGADSLDRPHKCSVVFDVENKPGTLLNVLSEFKDFNLIKIESRPFKTDFGRYFFFVSFVVDDSAKLKTLFDNINKKSVMFKVLGIY